MNETLCGVSYAQPPKFRGLTEVVGTNREKAKRIALCFIALLTGCATQQLTQVATPSEVYGKVPDPGLACKLLEASRCAYAIDETGSLKTGDVNYSTCTDGLREWKPIDDRHEHINAVLAELTADSVIVAYRGTLPPHNDRDRKEVLKDWFQDMEAEQVTEGNIEGRMHDGFHRGFIQTWNSLLGVLQEWKEKGELESKKIYVTGHSKGGAMAIIASLHLYNQGFSPEAVYTFAAARAGNQVFVKGYDVKGITTWRYENRFDIVPHLPPNATDRVLLASLLDKIPALRSDEYQSAGYLMFIDWDGHLRAYSTGLSDERIKRFYARLEEPGAAEVIIGAHSSNKDRQYYQAICGQMSQ